MGVGYGQRAAALPPLGGVLRRLHKGNLEVKVRVGGTERGRTVRTFPFVFFVSLS